MQHKMDKMFRSFWDRPFRVDSEDEDFARPANFRKAFTDFEETPDAFILRVELPGMKKEDISLDITEEGLEIRAEKQHEEEQEEKERRAYSRSFAGFYQRIALPEHADVTHIDAEYKDGVLTIKVPKTAEKRKRKEVRIK